MQLYYVIHSDSIVEFIISQAIKDKHYIVTLEDILKTNNILDPYSNLSFHSNCESTSTLSSFFYINYTYFNKILIPILENNGFIVIPHEKNKISFYYIQYDENTIEIVFDHTSKRHNEFIILVTFLKYVLETINQNNKFTDTDDAILKVNASLSKYKIIIQSKYLFTELPQQYLAGLAHAKHANSIMKLLKLNGFNAIELGQPQQYLYNNKFTPK